MDALYQLRIIDGPVAVACWVLGVVGSTTLLALAIMGRHRDWRRGVVLMAVTFVLAVVLTGVVHWILVDLLNVFPEDLPAEVLTASGFGVLGLLLAMLTLVRLGAARRAWGRRAVSVLAAAATVLLSGQLVNAYFGLNRTIADLAGVSTAHVAQLEPALERSGSRSVPLGRWSRPPEGLPHTGDLRTAPIPGAVSGFKARPAYIYLPPAYFAPTRPELPVLLLMPGQPGNPSDWLSGGRLREKLDLFAAEHGGIAPVAVVVDPLGSPSANTMCMDTKLGAAETYLVRDVIPWIKTHLTVATTADRWASGGFSFGGTCSVQLLAKHPDLVSGALAFAAEEEPALAKERSKTIDLAFDGDAAAFDSQVPSHFFAASRHDGLLLFLAAGSRDQDFQRQAAVIGEHAGASGVEVHHAVADGEGHSWEMIAKTWLEGMSLLAQRWGLDP
ncbi:alpha/beta hydrolase [Sinomonas sp.]|uniref:alpha/beta hydrolase n=1 Tax=Sinomonas sp. TaxID=1914986 RepID=UPI003F7CD636